MLQYGHNSTALYHVAVILDPLSETAQRWSSLLEVCDLLVIWCGVQVNNVFESGS
jgi:hypothetical protein